MREQRVDVAVIGAGTAGLVAYRQAKNLTENVVIIEGAEYGTTCARVGCMPSKLLIAAADAAHHARHAAQFGVQVPEVAVDGRAVLERVRRERDRFVGFVLESVDRIPEADRLRGMARFEDPHTLLVGDDTRVVADRIVIANGSSTSVPGFLRAAGKRFMVSDDVFEWPTLPESVVVFGPGVIGLEIGQALARLGVRVRMFGIGGLVGPLQDAEVRKVALEVFNEEFPLDADAKVEEVRETDLGVEVAFREGGTLKTERFDYLLAATGRRPNVHNLNIEAAGLALDEHGIPKFNRFTLQCGDSHIFIAGDANNHVPLLHEAADEGRIAGTNAGRFPDVRAGERRTPLAVVFSDPQIATVGRTLPQTAVRCGECFEVGTVRFEDQGRSRVMGKNRGILRVYGENGSGRFLGAEMLGPDAEHIGHLMAWAAEQRLTVRQMLAMPFYHPVVEEGLRTALRDLQHRLKLGPEMVDRCMDCGPGA
jgi:dihydrolipoamide dehydrogenase